MPELPTNEENKKERDHQIREDKSLRIEGRQERGVSGDDDEEDVDSKENPWDVREADGYIRQRGNWHILCLDRCSHSQMCQSDESPSNECSRARDGQKVAEDLSCAGRDVQEGQKADQVGCDDGRHWHAALASPRKYGWSSSRFGLGHQSPRANVDSGIYGGQQCEDDDCVDQVSSSRPASCVQGDRKRTRGGFRLSAQECFGV